MKLSHNTRVLVIEDEPSIQKLLKVSLEADGIRPVIARTGAEGIKKIHETKSDLIILDMVLPDINGWDVLRIVKQDKVLSRIPVIILTGEYKKTVDTIKALDGGADDYILKPFSPRILLARIRAILRRSANGTGPAPASNILSTPGGEICMDTDSREVVLKLPSGKKKAAEKMTVKEFELLSCFLKNPFKVFSRRYLFELVWNMDYYGTTRTIDKHVERLRSKLDIYGEFIKTVQGVGYQFNLPEE